MLHNLRELPFWTVVLGVFLGQLIWELAKKWWARRKVTKAFDPPKPKFNSENLPFGYICKFPNCNFKIAGHSWFTIKDVAEHHAKNSHNYSSLDLCICSDKARTMHDKHIDWCPYFGVIQ